MSFSKCPRETRCLHKRKTTYLVNLASYKPLKGGLTNEREKIPPYGSTESLTRRKLKRITVYAKTHTPMKMV